MKRILTILLLLLSFDGTAQILKNTSLNLNPGGVIHDVVYDSYYDAYIVVGDFISINGQTCNNLAFIDASTDSVRVYNPITSIDGAIRSVEIYTYSYNHPILGFSQRSYLYLGGNFTTINGQGHVYLARLSATHVFGQPPVNGLAPYNLNTWDPDFLYLGWNETGVYDLLLTSDTLVATGRFYTDNPPYTIDQYNNIIAFNAQATNPTLQPLFTNFAITNSLNYIMGVRKLGNSFYTFGRATGTSDEFIYEHDQNGVIIQQIESCGTESVVWDFEPHPTTIDTMLFSFERYAANDGITSYTINGNLWHCQGGGSGGNSMLNLAAIGVGSFFEVYDDFIINSNSSASMNGLHTTKRNGTSNVPVLKSFSLNTNWSAAPNLVGNSCVKKSRNLLFLSGSNLTTIGGSPRVGLGVFCLEPTPAKPFTQSDPTACEEDISIYTIPQAQCADGYRWSYTGTGALYRITGSGSAWTSLTTVELAGTNANSIEVYYPLGTTSGTLSVEPFTQFTASERTFSQGQSIVISINPKPDIILAPTHTLNCYSDTVLIVVQSLTPNVTYNWVYNNGGATSSNDTILITSLNGQGFDSSNYIVTVTNPLTGCFDSDTTFFTFDLIANPIDASLTTTNPAVWTCNTTSMTVNSNQTNYIVEWENTANPGAFFSDPLTLTSAPNGFVYNLHGIQISNGCPTQDPFGAFSVNMTQADGTLVGYNYMGGGTAIDTLTCNNPSITIQCTVTAPFASNSTAEWLDGSGTPTGSDMLTLSESDANGASFMVRQFRTLNNDNGCTQIYNVQVLCDFVQPLVGSIADQTINCSQNEILLTHPLNGSSNVMEGWLDGSGTQTASDTITASATGDYYYQVQSTLNGCSNYDTVSVVQTLDLLLDMPQDTLICPNEVVTIAPTVIGNTETPTYLWSTGATSPTETGIGGVDTELIVTISTPSGCSGTDTTAILITAPVDVTVTPFAGCTNGSLEITNVTGGAGNNQYSIDGTTWTDSTNFSGLSFGTYTVSVQDDLGCIYDTTALLDGTAQSVEMSFAASTYNEEGDTIILVNITDFTGLDSVAWNLPPTANVVYLSDSVAILAMATSGWYDVELIGYLDGNCEFSYVNPVFFGDHAPFFDDSTFFNGIDSLNVYPNPLNISGGSDLITVYIEFGKTQNYTILVTNTLGQPIPSMSVSGVGEIVSHDLYFPTGTAAGTYRVHVIADYDVRHAQITLQ